MKSNHKTERALLLLISLLISSCDLLRDSSFEVEAWTPGGGYHSSPETLVVSLLFSHDPERTGTEQAFSLSEDGLGISGSISWEGRRLIFTPAAPLEPDRNYTVTVLPDAADTEGVSLERKFEASFTTRPGSVRPKLVSLYPPDGGILALARDRVELGFSEAVTLNSCVDYISLSPSQTGSWQLTDDERTAIFTPAEPWAEGTRYRLNVSSLFSGKTGLTMGEDFFSHFTAGVDSVPPVLTGAYRIDPSGKAEELVPDVPGMVKENVRWEGDTRLRLDFSEPVSTASLLKCLAVEPGPSLVMETAPGFAASLVFGFSERPAYGSRFLIRLNSGILDGGKNKSAETHVFRIYADGVFSKPPAFVGIRLPVVPWGLNGSGKDGLTFSIDQPLVVLPVTGEMDETVYGIGKPAWVELYFDTAEGAAPDIFSVRELFRVEATNNALSFSPLSIAAEDFSSPDPPPEWAAYKRLEVRGELKDTTNSGIVSFSIGSGLVDTRGNRNEKAFRLPLLK
jgi:hypothetical protein